jgi:hypothetical protein
MKIDAGEKALLLPVLAASLLLYGILCVSYRIQGKSRLIIR